MHAATKAGTLGAGLLIIAEALFYRQLGISLRAVTVIALLLLTAPVAAHLIARASYLSGVELSDRTWIDELKKPKKRKILAVRKKSETLLLSFRVGHFVDELSFAFPK